jgi:hypothetical protein
MMTVGPATGYGTPTGYGIGRGRIGMGMTSGMMIGTGSHGRHDLVLVIHDVTVGSYIVVPPPQIVVGRTVILGRVVIMMGLVVIGRVVIMIGRVVIMRGGRDGLGSLGMTSRGVVLGRRGIAGSVGLVCHGGIDVRAGCLGMFRGS